MEYEKVEYVTDEQLKQCTPDLPVGPLDGYRTKASFDWRRMKLVYDTIQAIKLKHDIWEFMRHHPLFQHTEATRPLDEERNITTKRMYAMYAENFVPYEKIVEHPRLFQAESEAMFMFDSSLAVKVSLAFRMPTNTIQGSGREHHFSVLEAIQKAQFGGCFALTEIAHGSNAKGMRTTATYVPEKKQFVLHTPDFEAAKCWAGGLGKCATHAVLYAMLISKGKNHGLHAFVVPLRDPETLKPYPGVIVGDMGEKIGLNGIDNGFVMFNNYHLPKEAALDKLGGVDDDGNYQTPFRDASKRFGASLGILSGGRVHITTISTNYLQKAIVIAIRYSAVRKQFGPENSSEEFPVLEYQQQQIRLLPYLAAAYAQRVIGNWFSHQHLIISIERIMGIDNNAAGKGIEIHALSSTLKSICGWTARDGIQNCRECCGGHGYLKASGIGELRNDNDANCTYEGENSLLLQQTSNWLLTVWSRRKTISEEDSPFGSLEFMKAVDDLGKGCVWSSVEEIVEPSNLIYAYQWLTVYMLKMTHEKVTKLKGSGKDNFTARNDSQSYNAATLSVVYGEHFILNHFYKTALAFEDVACRKVLLKLVALYGAFLLEKHMATLYIGGFFSKDQGLLLREGILRLCQQIAPEAVALVDTLAPPDFCLKSVLGASDGEAYKRLESGMVMYPGAMERPQWWRDVVHWNAYATSKL